MGLAGGKDFFGAFDFAGEIGGLVDADLELAVEAGVVFRKSKSGTAACAGEEAFELGEGLDLLLGHLADFTEGSALGDAAIFDELDLVLEDWSENDVWLAGDGVFFARRRATPRPLTESMSAAWRSFESRRRVLMGKSKVRLAGMTVDVLVE